jgi:hypothetical protein
MPAAPKSASPLLSAFNKLGHLVKSQNRAISNYDVAKTYGEVNILELEQECLKLFVDSYQDMSVGEQSKEKWNLPLVLKNKGTLDPEILFSALRKLPDADIQKVRYFNRFIGQQLFSTTYEEFHELQESKVGVFQNAFYTKFMKQTGEFGKIFNIKLPNTPWPKERLMGPDRDAFVKKVGEWQNAFKALPGIERAHAFFKGVPKDAFNTFFHLQRQFDSPTYRDLGDDGTPYPQPLPRIAAYRIAIEELQTEFTELESSVSMCFDYCKMSVEKVVGFVLEAEDAFLRITCRLDHDYPIDVDFCHQQLHERAHDVKMMMFPLRCLFFDELDARRKVADAADNTLDSYMDMTLGETEVHIPPAYEHKFKTEDLLPEIVALLSKVNKAPLPPEWGTVQLIQKVQKIPHAELDPLAAEFSTLSDQYETQFKSDENDLNRRCARLGWLYLKAMSKKDDIAKASQERLNNMESMADEYAAHAERFANADIGPDGDMRSLTDDQLPLMASPQQMEDLFRTSHVVGKLGANGGEFEEKAKKIEAGLKAAMDMMKQAGELMDRMVTKMFPKKEDSSDLLEAIHQLIELGYETQQALADLAKQESMASRDKRAAAQCVKLKEEVQRCKNETAEIQGKLRDVLAAKRGLVDIMRITKAEKDYYYGQLRMITVMTIQSIKSQTQKT